MLRIADVTKHYTVDTFGSKEITAVSGVSFDLHEGEVVSLIGESGSGKSTVGRMILRLTRVSRGSISLDGQDIGRLGGNALRDYYASVQGVFQDPFSSFNPVFKVDRVFDMIRSSYLGGLGDAEWRTRLHRSLEDVDLNPGDVLGKYPHQLSGGQLQRLLIARALVLELRYLIADEIISMLDASTRIDVLNLLGDLKRRGLGVLFVTHDLSLGNYISDRTIILRRGHIVEMGATVKVFGDPRHSYTRMLLESVPKLHERWSHEPGRGARAVDEPGSPTGSRDLELVAIEPDHLVAPEHGAGR